MNKMPIHGAVFACAIFSISIVVRATGISGQGTWETTLQGRDLDGNASTVEAYYDTVLDITWLADANVNGSMTWGEASKWVASLDFGAGINNWRLPSMIDSSNDGCNYGYVGTDCAYNVQTGSASTTVYSELASMFYDTLGNRVYFDTSGNGPQSGWGLTNTGPFNNVQSDYYWSSTEYAPDTGGAWGFSFYEGYQDYASKDYNFHYAWAVHSGDVGAPLVAAAEPSVVWSFWSSLLDLIGLTR